MTVKAKPVRKPAKKEPVKYDLKSKLEVVELYRANDYNANKTERETGVSKVTIRKWHILLGCDQKRKNELESIREAVVKEVAIAKVNYVEVAQNMRMAILAKLEGKIADTNDINKLINIGRFVNEVLTAQGGVTPPTVNFFNQLNQQLIQNNVIIKDDEAKD